MITVIDRERIRRAYYVEGKSMRQIAAEWHHSYWTVRKALDSAEPQPYTLTKPKPAPVLGPYLEKLKKLLEKEADLPRKQRYTTRKLFELIWAEGYRGSESNLRRYVGAQRREMRRPRLFIPLSYEPGQDGQVDWGEADVIMNGRQVTAQLFVMRLCYSRRTFVMAFPTQKQESFFNAHASAFRFFRGVPHTLSYDNLKTAVKRVLKGRNRQEQDSFITFRSHYLFDSRFCTPGEGHEKGGVEHGVKYVRTNFLVPLPRVRDYAELNAWLQQKCLAEDERRVDRQPATIGAMWQAEQDKLRPLPARDFLCYRSREVTLNPYSQVVFETNRYSVPSDRAQKQLTLRAYPFRIEIFSKHELIASHQRSYERQQDILNPMHYLPLLLERPGAFEHATPVRQWRAAWPPLYDDLLAALKRGQTDALAVREFVRILQLHQANDAALVQTAIVDALTVGMPNLSGVQFCLHRLLDPTPTPTPLTTLPAPLAAVGPPVRPTSQYNRLLREVVS